MSPHRIANVDLDVWERQFVSTTINIVGGLEIAPWECVGNPDTADVVLVNADSSRGAAYLERYAEAAPGRPVVVPCAKREGGGAPAGGVGLGRPIAYAELIALLRRLEANLRETQHGRARAASATGSVQPVSDRREREAAAAVVLEAETTDRTETGAEVRAGSEADSTVETAADTDAETAEPVADVRATMPDDTASDIDTAEPQVEVRAMALTAAAAELASTANDREPEATDPSATTGRYLRAFARPAKRFFADTRFAGLLKQALGKSYVTEIAHPVWPIVTIYPMLQAYTSTADPVELVPMFRTSALEFTTRQIEFEVAVGALDDRARQPLWRLFFAAYLHGAEGRLLPHGDREDWLHLIDAPDLEQMPYVRDHRRLAEYLQEHSQKLAVIVQATGINIEVVIDFCNACEAVGLLERISATGRPGTLVALRAPFEASGLDELLNKSSAARAQHGITSWLDRVRQLFR